MPSMRSSAGVSIPKSLLIRQVSEYIINSGGKRLRPALVLLSAGAFGFSGTHHHELAAVVEFIHTATLLHDDVVDESSLRRGNATANAMFGNAASVLVGDFLYSRAFQMMVGVNSLRVMEVLADATNIIAEGEVLQLLNCHDPDIDEARYLQVIHYKTAKLFEAASRLGAILGGASPQDEEAMAEYGMHLGTAFQLIDDVLDYSGEHARYGQERGRRSGRRQADAAPDLCHANTAAPIRRRWFGMPSSRAAWMSCSRSCRRFVTPVLWITPRRRQSGKRMRPARQYRTCRVQITRILCYNWPTLRSRRNH